MTTQFMHLLQLCDSALPVGSFTFSIGIETATTIGRIKNHNELEEYLHTQLRQATWSDAIAALSAFRAAAKDNYADIRLADLSLIAGKPNAESRIMLTRMGRKLAELSHSLHPTRLNTRWLEEILQDKTPGSYPVTQALCYAENGLSEKMLFCAIAYGVCSMILNAALRQLRVSHLQTQKILWQIAQKTETLYEQVRSCTLEDISSFAPLSDIWASMHEKGSMRMFAN